MLLIPVRHGETEWNAEGREIGQLDSPLTDRGLEQAEALARRLSRFKIDALYSSDLGRAQRTAETIARRCGTSVNIDVTLRERHMGVFQGLTAEEVRAQYPAERRAYERDGFYDVIPGGETAGQRQDRSREVLTRMAARHAGETVVLVTHSGMLTGFFETVLDLPSGSSRLFKKSHAAFNAFEYHGSMWSLVTWNDTRHLEDTKD